MKQITHYLALLISVMTCASCATQESRQISREQEASSSSTVYFLSEDSHGRRIVNDAVVVGLK